MNDIKIVNMDDEIFFLNENVRYQEDSRIVLLSQNLVQKLNNVMRSKKEDESLKVYDGIRTNDGFKMKEDDYYSYSISNTDIDSMIEIMNDSKLKPADYYYWFGGIGIFYKFLDKSSIIKLSVTVNFEIEYFKYVEIVSLFEKAVTNQPGSWKYAERLCDFAGFNYERFRQAEEVKSMVKVQLDKMMKKRSEIFGYKSV